MNIPTNIKINKDKPQKSLPKISYVSLKKDSQQRIDARNCIIYSFFLDYNLPKIEDINDSNMIENIIRKCKEICSKLWIMERLNFFGDTDNKLLLYLNWHAYNPSEGLQDDSSRYPDFSDMILHHCLFSTYHAVVSDLFYDNSCTSYQIINKIKNQGIYQLDKKGYFQYPDQNDTVDINKKIYDEKSSSQAILLSKKLLTRSKIDYLKEVLLLLQAYAGEESVSKTAEALNVEATNTEVSNKSKKASTKKYKLATANIVHDIAEICNTKSLRSVFSNSADRHHDYSIYLNGIRELYNALYSSSKIKSTDDLYRLYILENLFGFDINYTVLYEMNNLIESEHFSLFATNIMNALFSIRKLPNVYSRSYFLRYALEHIYKRNDTNSYRDYWLDRNRNFIRYDPHIMASRSNEVPFGFYFDKWLNQFTLFVDYLSEFIIPIFEWCFICLLLDTIDEVYPNLNHIKKLEKVKNLLSDYIYKNKDIITNPIILKKTEKQNFDYLSFDSSNKWTNLSDKQSSIKGNWASIIDSMSILRPNSIDLRELNPKTLSFNRYSHNDSDNFREFHKFYIELFKDNYIRL